MRSHHDQSRVPIIHPRHLHPARDLGLLRIVRRLHAELCYRDEPVGAGTADAAFLDRVVDTTAQTHDALAAQYFAT